MRKAFVKKLTELVSNDEKIYLLTGDLGFSVFDDFRQTFPNNFINMGLSEASMIGAAAGMAMEGRRVFVYSIIPFVTFRVLEQIRNDICLQNLPVKIIGVGEGLTYGTSGPTHHAIEDIGIMSSLPNMVVLSPGDPIEVEKLVEESVSLNSPCYIRLGKSSEAVVNLPDSEIRIGVGNIVKCGEDLAIITTGNMLSTCFNVSKSLESEGINAMVVSLHTIKPLDEQLLNALAQKVKHVFVVEEHISSCGLGSRIAYYYANRNSNVNMKCIGLPDSFISTYGKQEFLRMKYGLDEDSLKREILRCIGRA
ncbi:MAG TPA: transketolase C-terminal domain-containing protein [Fervidobacterium sp.]|nr:transketolase C-terminal domain-containing protein [Fervidobacterium sp.]